MAPFGDEDICGLDVSVDDAFGMGSVQSIGNFDSRTEQVFKLHRPTRDGVFQCFALQTFHRDEAPAVMLADFVDGANVRMIQRRSGTSLSAEPFKGLRVSRQFIGQEFEGDEAAEFSVLSLENHTHAASAELFDDDVVRDGLADHVVADRVLGDRFLGDRDESAAFSDA